ncbi:MAG: hypothetical protein H0T79_06855, partial [Deltaproteobacteria bacterium]|nr:hypothetical protein [Deltaproteobacteria bacterium]
LDQLATLPDEVQLELAHLAHRHGRLALDPTRLHAIVALAAESPFWRGRFT